MGLMVICLFWAHQAIWAAPSAVPRRQVLPTAPPLTTVSPALPMATAMASPTPSPTRVRGEETITPAVTETSTPLARPMSFLTPVYGVSSPSAGDQSAARADDFVALKDDFAKIFPIWCFWPLVGLILLAAGMDLRARYRRRPQ